MRQLSRRVVWIGLTVFALWRGQALVETVINQDGQTEQSGTSPQTQQQPLDPLQQFRSQKERDTRQRKPEYAKGEVIIKFKPTLKKCAHCLLEKRQKFSTSLTDSSASLDEINERFQVRSARPLFRQWHHESIQESKQMYQKAMEETKRKFTRRSARAPKDAKLPDITHIYVLYFTS